MRANFHPLTRSGASFPSARSHLTGAAVEVLFAFAGGEVAFTALGEVQSQGNGLVEVRFDSLDALGKALWAELFPGCELGKSLGTPRPFAIEIGWGVLSACLNRDGELVHVTVPFSIQDTLALMCLGLARGSPRLQALNEKIVGKSGRSVIEVLPDVRRSIERSSDGPLGAAVWLVPASFTFAQRAALRISATAAGLPVSAFFPLTMGLGAAFSFGKRWTGRRILAINASQTMSEAALIVAKGDQLVAEAVTCAALPENVSINELMRSLRSERIDAVLLAGDSVQTLGKSGGSLAPEEVLPEWATVEGGAYLAAALAEGAQPALDILSEPIALAQSDGSLVPLITACSSLPMQRALEIEIARSTYLSLYSGGTTVKSAELIFHAEVHGPRVVHLSLHVDSFGFHVQLFDREGTSVPLRVLESDAMHASERLIAAPKPTVYERRHELWRLLKERWRRSSVAN